MQPSILFGLLFSSHWFGWKCISLNLGIPPTGMCHVSSVLSYKISGRSVLGGGGTLWHHVLPVEVSTKGSAPVFVVHLWSIPTTERRRLLSSWMHLSGVMLPPGCYKEPNQFLYFSDWWRPPLPPRQPPPLPAQEN